ncbi:MAG: hypothetical protein ACOYBP_08950 [Microbacteriaceae bacterium]
MALNPDAFGVLTTYGTYSEAALAWSECVDGLFSSILPASTTTAAAKPALAVALLEAFQKPTSVECIASMELAFSAYAATVAGGMAGWAAVVPPAPVGFAVLFSPPYFETQAQANQAIADAVYQWALTGSATQSGTGTVANWS